MTPDWDTMVRVAQDLVVQHGDDVRSLKLDLKEGRITDAAIVDSAISRLTNAKQMLAKSQTQWEQNSSLQ
jgi:hypothetical protein